MLRPREPGGHQARVPVARHYDSRIQRAAAARAVQLALVIASLACPSPAAAQQGSDDAGLETVRAAVSKALALPRPRVSFEELRLVRDRLGAVVCGKANGKRFLAGPSGKPPPQIEGALSAPMFNYLWNARCRGMSASQADEALGRELK